MIWLKSIVHSTDPFQNMPVRSGTSLKLKSCQTRLNKYKKRAVKTILPNLSSHSERLVFLKLDTLADRRQLLGYTFYKSIVIDDTNKLNRLLSVPTNHPYSLRTPKTFPLFKCNTDRFSKSFICQALKLWDSCAQDYIGLDRFKNIYVFNI